jgi:molybdate transport system substrate-binding protein
MANPTRKVLLFTPFALCLVCAIACRTGTPAEEDAPLTIFAASSLTDVFEALADEFSEQTGMARPRLAFAGSQVLRLHLSEGAKADLFASASLDHIEALVAERRVFDPRVFAENELVVIVPQSNPASLERFADLRKARRIVIGSPEVPIGIYTRQLLAHAESYFGPDFVERVRANVVSEENNVRLVRAKVELGEADAAIVYRTDVSPRVRTIEVPAELTVRVRYYLGFVGAPPHSEAAKQWSAFLDSPGGQSVLSKHGFATP